MGILKAIADAVKEKTKEEIVRYLKKIAEENAAKPAPGAMKPQERHDRSFDDHRRSSERRDEHKSHSSAQERRDERDPRPPHHDQRDRELPSYDPYDRDGRRNDRFEKYREKYHDNFSDRRDRDERPFTGEKPFPDRGRDEYPQHRPPLPAPSQKPQPPEQPKPAPQPPARVEPKPQQPQMPPAVKPAPVPPKEEWVAPVNDTPIEKAQITLGTDEAVISIDLARMIQQLPPQEYTLYLKLFLYSYSVRKNYGYIGAGLKKSIGFADTAPAEFDRLLHRLSKRGLLSLEKISDFQSTYILYLPFDETRMTRVEEKKEEEEDKEEVRTPENEPKPVPHPQPVTRHPAKGKEKEKPREKEAAQMKGKGRGREPEKERGKTKEPEKPAPKGRGGRNRHAAEQKGKAAVPETPVATELPDTITISMDEDQLLKAYRTFVSMEIDKAKMRVGRSNFDKIYMEAVKYIDKKYGFKVLSDQERFREYLTQYYVSAFDIPNFEEWRKSKA